MTRPGSLLILFALIALIGCGGNTGNNNQGPPMTFFSGLHSISGGIASDPSTSVSLVGSLMQNGSSLSGIMHFRGSSCFAFATDIPVAGNLTPSEADFTATLPNGQTLVFSGMKHLFGKPALLSGSYSVTGAGCIPSVQGGGANDAAMNFSATYNGTFVSSTGNTAHVTLSLNQTGPDARGFFSATGTATITGGTCFSSATLDASTVILGDGSTLVLDDTAAGSTGQTISNGNFSQGLTNLFFSGTYTSTKGACSETGNLTLMN